MKRILYFILMLAWLGSCIEKYSGFQIKSETSFILPIAHGSFELGDLLNSFDGDSMFQTDIENELVFTYRNNELSTFNFSDLIEFPYSLELINESRKLGNIHLKDTAYYEYIPLQELIARLSFIPEISTIPEGTISSFSGVTVGAQFAPFLTWEIGDFDYVTKAEIISGTISINLTNEFPLNCKVIFEFYDAEGTYIDEHFFGGNSITGLKPKENESYVIDLAGRHISAPLSYKIVNMQFLESLSPVYVEYSRGFNIVVSVNDLILSSGNFNAGKFSYEGPVEQINVSFVDSVQLGKMMIESGYLQIVIRKLFSPNGLISVYLPGLFKDNEPFSTEFPLEGEEWVIHTIDLTGMELNLRSENGSYNSIQYAFGFKNTTDDFIELNATDRLSYSIALQQLVVEYIEGDFGPMQLNLSQTGLSLNPEVWDRIGGEVFGNSPVLTIYFRNTIGIPILYDFDLEATNRSGDRVIVNTSPFVMPFPLSLSESPVFSEKEFTVENSNIMEFIQLPPNDTMTFHARLTLNPGGPPLPGQPNFVDLREPFIVGIGFKVPILVKGLFFSYVDTLGFSMASLDGAVKRASLLFRTRNEIPLQVDLSVTPFDSITMTATGETLWVTLLDAAPTDEFGNVTGIREAENILEVSGSDLKNLKLANSLIVRASFMSPGEGNKPAKLKNEFGFDLKIILDISPDL